MVQFERQFENLDVQSEFVEQSMNNQAVLSTPEEDVNLLMQQARPRPDALQPLAALVFPGMLPTVCSSYLAPLTRPGGGRAWP